MPWRQLVFCLRVVQRGRRLQKRLFRSGVWLWRECGSFFGSVLLRGFTSISEEGQDRWSKTRGPRNSYLDFPFQTENRWFGQGWFRPRVTHFIPSKESSEGFRVWLQTQAEERASVRRTRHPSLNPEVPGNRASGFQWEQTGEWPATRGWGQSGRQRVWRIPKWVATMGLGPAWLGGKWLIALLFDGGSIEYYSFHELE